MSKLTDKTNIQWFPGHMTKTLRMVDVEIKNIDIVLMLLDARIPFSSINPELKKYSDMKPYLYILNKSDLADENITQQWVQYFKNEDNIALAVNSKNRGDVNRLKKEIDIALNELKNRQLNKGMVGSKVRVLVCGIPNVGKSTFINTFIGQVRAKAADKPGVTRGKQWITTEGYDFLDIPGVLWPKFENQKIASNLALIGSIKSEILDVEEIASDLLQQINSLYKNSLIDRFNITEPINDKSGYELLEIIARKRGCVISGGELDLQRAATIVLSEFRSAKFGRISLEIPFQ